MLYAQRTTSIVTIVLLIAAAAMADVKGEFTLFRNRTTVWPGDIPAGRGGCGRGAPTTPVRSPRRLSARWITPPGSCADTRAGWCR
ncbi:hypothetical protein ACFWBX_07905 [Streptomyces sp. NPDC059991]|uniref:hypothetical protein n=1 Tax=Streptomyces sp. NPDC059991 TaxID=3347028 RepID=UPI00369F038E